MKFNSMFFLAILQITNGFTQTVKQYQVEITLNKAEQHNKVFLRYFTEGGPIVDSASSQNGKFVFTGIAPVNLVIARLFIPGEKANSCELWLEPGTTRISAEKSLGQALYDGSEEQLRFSELQKNLQPVKKKNIELDETYEKVVAEKDDEKKDKLLNEEYPALFKQKQKVLGDFILKYPSSFISAYKFDEFAGDEAMDLSIVEPVYAALDNSIKQHPRVKKTALRMEINKLTAMGMNAPEFTQADTLGNPVSLSSFRGKYLFIDFWAGWCAPCRTENPHLIKVYDRFKSKGLEILGVSLDGERKRWTDAIITDKLVWTHVSDLQIFENAVAKQYGITSIPQNILIDPAGKIIAKNLRGSALDKKLEEIFE